MLENLYDKIPDGIFKLALAGLIFRKHGEVSVHKFKNGRGMSIAEAEDFGLNEEQAPLFVQPTNTNEGGCVTSIQ